MSLVSPMSYITDTVAAFRSIATDDAPIVELEQFSEGRAHAAAVELLERAPAPDAIYCVNDLLAMGVAHAARERRLAVPRELGIAGVGDSALARTMSVPLTSVRVYPERVGVMLFELLIALIEGGGAALSQPPLLPAELVVRESTARS
jgi:LacI family repressor for deo operon, udp, cdd, tsx, nupC, and nupG